MEQRKELLCGLPALVLGAPSERVFFYVHGKMGSKEEALDFAEVADAHGWQVVSIDLPQHGQRQGSPVYQHPVKAGGRHRHGPHCHQRPERNAPAKDYPGGASHRQ